MYRTLAYVFLACAFICAADAQPQAPFPLWDGHESVEQYARRVNLPTTRTLDLGNGVSLELVLIPAGKFVMGTPKPAPKPVDGDGLRKGIGVLVAGVNGFRQTVFSGGAHPSTLSASPDREAVNIY